MQSSCRPLIGSQLAYLSTSNVHAVLPAITAAPSRQRAARSHGGDRRHSDSTTVLPFAPIADAKYSLINANALESAMCNEYVAAGLSLANHWDL